MKEKTCFKCNQVKPLNRFYKHKQMGDGHLNKCKDCTKSDTRQNLKKNRDYYKSYDRKRYRTNIARLMKHKYTGIVQRCTGGHKSRSYFVEGLPYLSWQEFRAWWKENEASFEKCYELWKESGYRNKYAPSIDRIDGSRGYVADNMQWLTFHVNCSKH